RLAEDEAVGDEPRVSRDVLEARHLDREERGEQGQELDLLLDLLDGKPVAWPSHNPGVVHDEDLEVPAVVELAQRRFHAGNATLAGGSCCCCGSFSSASRLRLSACP